MIISLIAALSKNYVIGVDNQLPWHLPKDLQFFRQTTLNKPIVMGRKTYDSIGRPLPKRHNIVLSRQQIDLPGCDVVHSVDEAIAKAGDVDELMIIGGSQVYELFMPKAQRLYVTLVETDIKGDAYFPRWNTNEWKEVNRLHIDKDDEHAHTFDMVTLER